MTPHDIARIAYNQHRASQRELELAMAVEVVAEAKPRIVVEIGCDAGGTLWAWRQICDDVFGITLPVNDYASGGSLAPLEDHGASVLRADSHDPAALSWLVEQLDGRPVDVLHIDGDHSYDGVRSDWEMYSPLVRPGGLVLIHDIVNHRDPRVDVPRFWQELEASHDTRTLCSPRNPVGFGVVTKGD